MRAPTRSQICVWLRGARDTAGLSRRTVSIALGVTERAIQSWEDARDTPMPPADKFLALVVLYGASLAELVPVSRPPIPADPIPIPRSAAAGAARRVKGRGSG